MAACKTKVADVARMLHWVAPAMPGDEMRVRHTQVLSVWRL